MLLNHSYFCRTVIVFSAAKIHVTDYFFFKKVNQLKKIPVTCIEHFTHILKKITYYKYYFQMHVKKLKIIYEAFKNYI